MTFFLLRSRILSRATTTLLELKQVHSAIIPSTFTAREAGIFSKDDLILSSGTVLCSQDPSTLHWSLWETQNRLIFLVHPQKYPTDVCSNFDRTRFTWYDQLKVGVHDNFLSTVSQFAALFDWFADAVFAIFGFSGYILFQCRTYFPSFSFLQYVITFLLKLYKTFSFYWRSHESIIILSFFAKKFSIYKTSEMVTTCKMLVVVYAIGKVLNVVVMPMNVVPKPPAGKREKKFYMKTQYPCVGLRRLKY